MKIILDYTKKYSIYIVISLLVIITILTTLFFTKTEPVLASNNKTIIPKKEKVTNTIKVEIKGAVNNPGVYELEDSSRVIDAINISGGLREDANTNLINLSKKLKDEMVIIIYTNEEIINYNESKIKTEYVYIEVENCPDKINDACIKEYNDTSQNKLVNLNTASLEEITSLPGIGESKAKTIIEYREKQKFNSIEDIQNIKGIGASLFEKIKENITV